MSMRSEESEPVRPRVGSGVDGGRRVSQTGAQLRQSHRRGRKGRRTTRSRLSIAPTGTYEELLCASDVTADSYAIHTGYAPGLRRGPTAPTPSGRRGPRK